MNRLLLSAAACGLVVSLAPAQIRKVAIATGLTQPLYVCTPNDPERLFVVEQPGRIRVIKNGTVLSAPFLDIITKVSSTANERGLLGLAFHPNYEQNGYFYVSYTRRPDSASVIERYQVSSNPDLADASSVTSMFGPIGQPFSNHNGGCIQFGPDGYLYFGFGDGGGSGDPNCRAQSRTHLLGKMLRLDVDNENSVIPPSNPFVGDPATRDEIWALGLRNPWRFGFDRENGDLYIADVGQMAWEEIQYQPASSTGGENYGWSIMEAADCFRVCAGARPCDDPSYTAAVHSYATGENCAIIGGYVYRGCAVPSLRGQYFYGDHCSGRIWTIEVDNGAAGTPVDRTALLGPVGNLVSFGEDHEGEILIVQRSGQLSKIVPSNITATDLGWGTTGGNGEIPRFTVCGSFLPGESAQLRLGRAAALTGVGLLIGRQNNPTELLPWGTIVPWPPLMVAGRATDAEGSVRIVLPGRTGLGLLYAQWIVIDPGATGGIAISNALEIHY